VNSSVDLATRATDVRPGAVDFHRRETAQKTGRRPAAGSVELRGRSSAKRQAKNAPASSKKKTTSVKLVEQRRENERHADGERRDNRQRQRPPRSASTCCHRSSSSSSRGELAASVCEERCCSAIMQAVSARGLEMRRARTQYVELCQATPRATASSCRYDATVHINVGQCNPALETRQPKKIMGKLQTKDGKRPWSRSCWKKRMSTVGFVGASLVHSTRTELKQTE